MLRSEIFVMASRNGPLDSFSFRARQSLRLQPAALLIVTRDQGILSFLDFYLAWYAVPFGGLQMLYIKC